MFELCSHGIWIYSGSSDDESESNFCAEASVTVAAAVSGTGDDTGAESVRVARSFALPCEKLL
jgi:hypothetical protein